MRQNESHRTAFPNCQSSPYQTLSSSAKLEEDCQDRLLAVRRPKLLTDFYGQSPFAYRRIVYRSCFADSQSQPVSRGLRMHASATTCTRQQFQAHCFQLVDSVQSHPSHPPLSSLCAKVFDRSGNGMRGL